jgi:hypothetical protein
LGRAARIVFCPVPRLGPHVQCGTQACLIYAIVLPPCLLLMPVVPLRLHPHLRALFPLFLPRPPQLVEVGDHNSRGNSMNRASVEGSNDLRPGSDGFRPLDATVVEVGGASRTDAWGAGTV